MLERRLEVGDVRLDLAPEDLPEKQVDAEDELLGDGQHQRPESRHVDLERLASDRHELLRQADADGASVVLALHRKRKGEASFYLYIMMYTCTGGRWE